MLLRVGGFPQLNKFEQVSFVGHQMSVTGAGPRLDVGGVVPYHVTYPMRHLVLTLTPCGQTDACENINSPQLRLRVVTI